MTTQNAVTVFGSNQIAWAGTVTEADIRAHLMAGGKVPAVFAKANAKLVKAARAGARSGLMESHDAIMGQVAQAGFKLAKYEEPVTLKNGDQKFTAVFVKPAAKPEPVVDPGVAAAVLDVQTALAACKKGTITVEELRAKVESLCGMA